MMVNLHVSLSVNPVVIVKRKSPMKYFIAFMSKIIMLSYNESMNIKPLIDKTLAHKFTAIVENFLEGAVRVGSILIELDSLIPAGIEDGMLIDFECSRLDLW